VTERHWLVPWTLYIGLVDEIGQMRWFEDGDEANDEALDELE
jgi:hypothetical protein